MLRPLVSVTSSRVSLRVMTAHRAAIGSAA
jgi:hypothetical protein